MNPKQDRPGARTPEDLERKYNFGEKFHDINEILQKQNIAMEKQSQLFSSYVGTNDKAMQTMAENYSKLLEKVSKLEGSLKTMGEDITAVGGKVTDVTVNLCKAKAGFMYPFSGGKVPDGFLLCNGSSYSRTAYPELFAVIGTTYGAGDGSTTFNVPNMAKRVPVGASTNSYKLGASGGEETHTLTVDEMPSHNHAIYMGYGDFNPAGIWGNRAVEELTNTTNNFTGDNGGSQPHNNMQPYTVVNYIIATGKTFVNTSTT